MPGLRTETMTVNMGPQHPSTHGVLRLVLELDGETIRSAAPTIGYLHTGIEKTAEQKKWQQVIPLVERMDYLSAQSNSMAFCMSVEKLLGLEIPERVRWIRVLMAELQRINSHLVWLGTHGMEGGVGVISREDAVRFSLLGPIARASGVDYDVRKVFPYLGYETFKFDVPVRTEGDVYARYTVRVAEMRESLKICRQALERISPTG